MFKCNITVQIRDGAFVDICYKLYYISQDNIKINVESIKNQLHRL